MDLPKSWHAAVNYSPTLLGRKKLDLPGKQAAAATGQSLLMHAWEDAFAPHAMIAAQVLLTRDDTEVRRRWLNAEA